MYYFLVCFNSKNQFVFAMLRKTAVIGGRVLFGATRRSFTAEALNGVNKDIMKLGRFNHVAIAVPSLDSSVNLYRDVLGAECSESVDLPEHGVTTVFVNLGNTKIELLGKLGDASPIAKFLEKNPAGGIHHICIEVKDIHAAMKNVQDKGLVVLSKEPKIGAHGKPVIFIHPKSVNGVLLELEQE